VPASGRSDSWGSRRSRRKRRWYRCYRSTICEDFRRLSGPCASPAPLCGDSADRQARATANCPASTCANERRACDTRLCSAIVARGVWCCNNNNNYNNNDLIIRKKKVPSEDLKSPAHSLIVTVESKRIEYLFAIFSCSSIECKKNKQSERKS